MARCNPRRASQAQPTSIDLLGEIDALAQQIRERTPSLLEKHLSCPNAQTLCTHLADVGKGLRIPEERNPARPAEQPAPSPAGSVPTGECAVPFPMRPDPSRSA